MGKGKMLETNFFPFLTLFSGVSETNLALYNVFILDLSNVFLFCSKVLQYSLRSNALFATNVE